MRNFIKTVVVLGSARRSRRLCADRGNSETADRLSVDDRTVKVNAGRAIGRREAGRSPSTAGARRAFGDAQ